MALRLTEKDKKNLQRVNANVRRKNNRLRDYGVKETLPVLRLNNVKSRKQLNEYYDSARRYLRGYGNRYVKVEPRASDNKYALPLSDVTSARRLARQVSKERERRFKEYETRPFMSRGKPTASSVYQRQLMGDDRYDVFKPVSLKLESFKSQKDFAKRVKTLEKMSSPDYIHDMNERLKENVKIAITNSWGEKGEKAKKIVDAMSDKEFIDTYFTEDIFAFEYIYDENQKDRKIEQFESVIVDYLEDDAKAELLSLLL